MALVTYFSTIEAKAKIFSIIKLIFGFKIYLEIILALIDTFKTCTILEYFFA